MWLLGLPPASAWLWLWLWPWQSRRKEQCVMMRPWARVLARGLRSQMGRRERNEAAGTGGEEATQTARRRRQALAVARQVEESTVAGEVKETRRLWTRTAGKAAARRCGWLQ
ncbi:hypothetical protein IWZ01DRAFT_525596 [Phyllosticta capitalensis]